MKTILQVTYDIRDRNGKEKTLAVKNLIRQTEQEYIPVTIDIIRVPKLSEEKLNIKNNHLEFNVFGLPYGIFLMRHLNRTYKRVAEQVKDIKYELVHAHKLSFDGVVGYKLALIRAVPLFITIRQSDIAVMQYRPDLIPYYKKILTYASKIIFLTPSIVKELEKKTGKSFFNREVINKLEFLPNIVERNVKASEASMQNYFLTIARMSKDYVKIKNIWRLLKAFSMIEDKKIKLIIVGTGSFFPGVKKWVAKLGLSERVEFPGAVPHEEIDSYHASAVAMVMPSKRESFGMVYAEALLNGTPIMYSTGVIGFDGVFNECGVGVDPFSIDSIRQGLEDLIKNNQALRETIKQYKQQNAFDIFKENNIRKKYLHIISEILEREENETVLS
jgi:glycosyltransferase involved in cell wall biosynthesis